jgi:hypothetical protein
VVGEEELIQAALVESDGRRLMLERVPESRAANSEPGRASGQYDEAMEEFDRLWWRKTWRLPRLVVV